MAFWSKKNKTDESSAAEESSGGLLGKFRKSLSKTNAVLNTDIRDIVGKEGRLVDDEFLDELFATLVKTDMGNATAMKIRDSHYPDHKLTP